MRKHSNPKRYSKLAASVDATSRSLIASAQRQDTLAWNRLVELYAPLVYCWCRWQRVPEQEIPDVFQEVFQAVAANLHKFRNDRPQDTFRGWLRTITRNKVNDHFRRHGGIHAAGGTEAQMWLSQVPWRDKHELDQDNGSVSTLRDHNRAQRAVFRQALELIRDHFEERTWKAFWGVVVDGRPTADVAEELSMRPGTVRVAKCRVLQRLRQELGDVGV